MRGGGKQGGRLAMDDAQVVLFRGVGRGCLLQLQHLPFRQVGQRAGKHPDGSVPVLRVHDQVHRPGQPEIPHQHGGGGSEQGRDRRAAAPLRASVGDVVVQERGVVQELRRRGETDAVFRRGSQGAGHQQGDQRTQQLAGIRQDLPVGLLQQADIGVQRVPDQGLYPVPIRSQIGYDLLPVHNNASSSSTVSGKCTRARDSASIIPR